MKTLNSLRKSRRTAILAASVLALTAIFSLAAPVSHVPGFNAHPAAAESVAGSNSGSPLQGQGCSSGCSSGSSYCNTSNGEGYFDGYELYTAPFPLCYDPGIPPPTAPAAKDCTVSDLVFRFYGTGNPDSANGPNADVVDSYSVSSVGLPSYCDNSSYTLFTPDPSDSGGTTAYDLIQGSAWCQAGVSRPTTLPSNGMTTSQVSCTGVSPSTFQSTHYDAKGDLTTTDPIAIVNNGGNSCSSLETSPKGLGPTAALLSNTSTINNPFGSNPKTVTVADAVRTALVGTGSQLAGQESAFDYWYHLYGGSTTAEARMAAAVIDDAAGANTNIAPPVAGSPSSVVYGSEPDCSSGLQYVTTSTSQKNFGVCVLPVQSLVDQFGSTWAIQAWTGTGSAGGGTYTNAGARFKLQGGNANDGIDAVPTWRNIIQNDVTNDRIGSGNAGLGGGPSYGFPWQAFNNNGNTANAPDPVQAGSQAAGDASCSWGTGGAELTGTSAASSVSEPAATLPPANAQIQITISSDPTYGATGGTLHPNVFTATATGLVCPDPSSGQYVDCNELYPGQYTLNSFSWQLSLDSNSSSYTECATQTSANCQYYVTQSGAGAGGTDTATAYFYSATQPGQSLSLNVAGASGSYTINALNNATSSKTIAANTITLCGDGVFKGQPDGLVALSCSSGSGGISFTSPTPVAGTTTTTTKTTTTTTKGSTTTVVTYSCPSGYTLSGTSCVTHPAVSKDTCTKNGDSWTGSTCTKTIAATKGSSSSTSSGPATTTTTLPQPETVGLGASNVPVAGAHSITVLGASSTPGA